MKKPFIMLLAFVLLCAGMLGAVVYAFWDTATESQRENRKLAELPTLSAEGWFSGSFARDFEGFLNDHVFQRDGLIDAAQRLEGYLEKEMEMKLVTAGQAPEGGTEPENQADLPPRDAPASGSGEAGPNQAAPSPEAADSVVILSDRILSTFTYSENNTERYVEAVSAFFDLFPDYVTKVKLLVPFRIAFEPPSVSAVSDDQKAAIQEVYSKLDPLIITVDAYSVLEANSTPLDDIFFRTDHHWTHYGAYLGAKAIFDTLEQTFATIDHYQPVAGDPFLGYLYAQNPSEGLKQHQDTLVCYFPQSHPVLTAENHFYDENGVLTVKTEPLLDPSRYGYYSFAARSYAWLDIQGANPQGPSVLLMGDSYCNALCTWVAENVSRLVVVDPREYDLGREGILELYDQYKFSQVIVCNYVNNLESGYYSGLMQSLTE